MIDKYNYVIARYPHNIKLQAIIPNQSQIKTRVPHKTIVAHAFHTVLSMLIKTITHFQYLCVAVRLADQMPKI